MLPPLFSSEKTLLGAMLLVLGGAVRAQAQAAATSQYQPGAMSFRPPQLLEGGGNAALVRAVQLRVVYPRKALRNNAQGASQVSFAVSPGGQVCRVKMLYGVRPDLDTAVVQAVRQLPQLQPATQHGRPVACLVRAPVTFFIDNAPPPPKTPPPATDSAQVYTAVEWLPRYREQTSYQQLAADLAAEYLRRGGDCFIPRLGASLVLTVGPSGTLYNVQPVPRQQDEQAALRSQFGDQVAQAEEGVETELPEACLPQLAEAVRHLPRLTPAYVAGRPVAMRLLLTLFNPKP